MSSVVIQVCLSSVILKTGSQVQCKHKHTCKHENKYVLVLVLVLVLVVVVVVVVFLLLFHSIMHVCNFT